MQAHDENRPVAESESGAVDNDQAEVPERHDDASRPAEIGGRDGPDPTRYGDWEKAGRCIDF